MTNIKHFEQGLENYKEALKWYAKAAEQDISFQGVSDARFNLGFLYAMGAGVEESKSKAYMWWSLAGSGDDTTHNLSLLKEAMSADEVILAKELIGRCIEKKYSGC